MVSLIGAGILFCIGGIYLFYRSVFEEDKSIVKALLVLLAGIILIGLGTARYYN